VYFLYIHVRSYYDASHITAEGIMRQQGRRVAIYARGSTDDQTTENQLRELRAMAERAGWFVVEEFIDHGIRGAKGRDKRPAFDRLLKAAARRQIDLVAAWSVDRLGRSLQHLVGFLDEIHSRRIDLYLHQQGIDTTTPAGKALFQMCGVFAEFERSMIQERVKAGWRGRRRAGRCWAGHGSQRRSRSAYGRYGPAGGALSASLVNCAWEVARCSACSSRNSSGAERKSVRPWRHHRATRQPALPCREPALLRLIPLQRSPKNDSTAMTMTIAPTM
jgi:DNA invertase Pin-like site-specific DNA recombinase